MTRERFGAAPPAAARRRWAAAVAGAYLAVIVLVLLFETDRDPGDVPRLAALLAPGVLATGVFLWGTWAWTGTGAWACRVLGWIGMAADSLVLVSFSFVLWPLLLSALPALWYWRDEPADGGHGRPNRS